MKAPLPRVFVALDGAPETGRSLAARLVETGPATGFGFKVNLDAGVHLDPDAPNLYRRLEALARLGRPLFLDWKMGNGGRTLAAVAAGVAAHPELGVAVINAYSLAGVDALARAADALAGCPTRLFGLTVLTHSDDAEAAALFGRPAAEAAAAFADRAAAAGCDGVVCPAAFAPLARARRLGTICPGIRPAWFADAAANAQAAARVATPAEARRAGADCLVVGTPVAAAPDPGDALRRVLAEFGPGGGG